MAGYPVPDDPWQQGGCHLAAGQLADDAQSLAATSDQWGQAGSWDEPPVMQLGWYPAQAGPAPQADADTDLDPDLLRTLKSDIQADIPESSQQPNLIVKTITCFCFRRPTFQIS